MFSSLMPPWRSTWYACRGEQGQAVSRPVVGRVLAEQQRPAWQHALVVYRRTRNHTKRQPIASARLAQLRTTH